MMAASKGIRDPSSHRTPAQINKQDRGLNASPAKIADRTKNNQARALMEKAGRTHKGDPRDVGHKDPLRDGGGNARNNLQMQTEHFNRGWEAGGKNR